MEGGQAASDGTRHPVLPPHCREARREGRVRGGAVTEEEKGSIKEERERERVES